MRELQAKLYEYEKVLKSWEADINWDVKNPLLEPVIDNTPVDDIDMHWISAETKPKNSNTVAVIIENYSYPTTAWYSTALDEWNLDDKTLSGNVIKWHPLPLH